MPWLVHRLGLREVGAAVLLTAPSLHVLAPSGWALVLLLSPLRSHQCPGAELGVNAGVEEVAAGRTKSILSRSHGHGGTVCSQWHWCLWGFHVGVQAVSGCWAEGSWGWARCGATTLAGDGAHGCHMGEHGGPGGSMTPFPPAHTHPVSAFLLPEAKSPVDSN